MDLYNYGKFISEPEVFHEYKLNNVPKEKWISKEFLRGLYVGNGKYKDDRLVLNIHVGDITDYINNKLPIVSSYTTSGLVFVDSNAVDFFGYIYDNIHISDEIPLTNKDTEPLQLMYDTKEVSKIPKIGIVVKDNMAVVPTKSIFSDAGYDISIISKEKTLIENRTWMFDTGIQLRIPNGYYVEIVPRSSLSKYGYILSNNIGIIDQSYMGNLRICLTRIHDTAKVISFPFRCCQMILRKQYHAQIEVLPSEGIQEEGKTKRGSGGFGSTDLSMEPLTV